MKHGGVCSTRIWPLYAWSRPMGELALELQEQRLRMNGLSSLVVKAFTQIVRDLVQFFSAKISDVNRINKFILVVLISQNISSVTPPDGC